MRHITAARGVLLPSPPTTHDEATIYGQAAQGGAEALAAAMPAADVLSALMLGWKFTQERGSSTRKWAMLSELSSREINGNEAAFLSMIDWRLYITT